MSSRCNFPSLGLPFPQYSLLNLVELIKRLLESLIGRILALLPDLSLPPCVLDLIAISFAAQQHLQAS